MMSDIAMSCDQDLVVIASDETSTWLAGNEVYAALDEAVRDLGLSESWELFTCEQRHWKVEVTRAEFNSIYDRVARGLIGKKLWMIAPIILTYFNVSWENWDSSYWKDLSPSSYNHRKQIIVDKKKCHLWSRLVDSETGELTGIHYHAAYLWDYVVSASSAFLSVRYDGIDANQVCCEWDFKIKKTPTEKAREAALEAQKALDRRTRGF